tara:strand:- start:7916 stop:8647 length:732 start_codon:yes stop_codon:yes gene_type:complete
MRKLNLANSLVCGLTLLASISAQAVVVDTSLWSTEVSPGRSGGPTGLTSAGGNQAVQNSNSDGTIVSDFLFNGDFNFSGFMTPTTASFNDNDLFGLVFGWQDASNHYRLGWEQGGYNDISGASGLFLVKEVAGVSSILFQQETFWADNVEYDFIVGRSGNDISFNLNGLEESFTDTTFMTGKVGFWTESQTARFGGLSSTVETPFCVLNPTDPSCVSTDVPVPAPIALIGLGLLGLRLRRQKA